ncbi:DNA polymerase III subunit delta' [Planctomycetes bacterium MalM25]|nr:DNA polymerase III subunit delta' [Planctomycetes bacterium MalM25]
MQPVIGHDLAKERLRRTLRRGRLASTYLFVGPEGVGKRRFAERLAAALLCHQPGDDPLEPCGGCAACQLSEAGTHPDLLKVARPEGKTTLPVDLFIGPADKRNRQGLCHDLALKPLVSDRRVAILDDADFFSVETANCLLKTLEEPPPRSLLILIGTSLARQLATIRSRSQVVRFGPLADEELTRVLTAPPVDFSPADAERLVPLARGSVSRAIELSEGSLDSAREALLGCLQSPRIDSTRLARVLEEESKAVATEPRIRRRALAELFGTAITLYHRRLAERLDDPDETVAAIDLWLEAEEALGRNANQSALVQALAERLARLAA